MTTKIKIKKRDGREEEVDLDKINKRIKVQARGLKNVDPMLIVPKVIAGIHDSVTTKELDDLAIKTSANLITTHPEYDTLAMKLVVSSLHKETSGSFFEVMESLYNRKDNYGKARPAVSDDFIKVVRKNKSVLDSEIVHSRDYLFDYLGISTLFKSYLNKLNNKVVERPQYMWLRVAIGIHGKDIESAIDTYHKLSQKYFTHATPTLFNAGAFRPQLASCFLLHMHDDSVEGIYKTLSDCAKISQLAGGIGVHVHNIRSAGSPIYGTGGISNGLVPMLRVYNATAGYIDQGGGKRKGSFAIYLEVWHPDIFEFLDLRRNTGKDEIRARDLFYGLWISDLFMKRVHENGDWTLMDPSLTPGLSDLWGPEFEKLYLKYEAEGKGVRTVKAVDLWKKILELQIETSMPYMMYKDACNRKSNQQNLGTIKSSNLCTEILEYTSPEEIAVCNLASLSLPAYVEGKAKPKFNHEKLHDIVKTVTINLNRVIDKNYYPLPEAKISNLKHRPIGIGVQGLADVFMKMRICWDSPEAFRLNREIFETIYHAALEASIEEAIADGPYQTFEGSPASKGLLQFDLWFDELKIRNSESITAKTSEEYYCDSHRYDWKQLKDKIKKHGLRNSLLLAPMPTASTASILGNTESFEPIPSNIYKRNVLSGEFVVINKYLVEDLMELNLWNDTIKQNIIAAEGSIQEIEGIPEEIKKLYRTVWELKQKDLIDLSADRGAFICQSQSLNIYMKEPNYKKLTSMHFYGWSKGLKTGSYYIRQTAARQAQKVTVNPDLEKGSKSLEILENKDVKSIKSVELETAISILTGGGSYTIEELNKMSTEDILVLAKGVCSKNNPQDCEMCSG